MDYEFIKAELQAATKIAFMPTRDNEKEPSVIALVFPRPMAVNGYSLLLKAYENLSTRLYLYKSNNGAEKINLAIIEKETFSSIDVKNLDYDKNQLNTFLSQTSSLDPFVFAISYFSNRGFELIATSEPFSPLVIDGYVIE